MNTNRTTNKLVVSNMTGSANRGERARLLVGLANTLDNEQSVFMQIRERNEERMRRDSQSTNTQSKVYERPSSYSL